MFKFLASFFRSNDSDDLSLDNAYRVLNELKLDEFPVNDEENKFTNERIPADDSNHRKMGIITSVKNGFFIIDDTYKFKSKLENLTVGMKIHFSVNVENGIVEIRDISIADQWNCVENSFCLRTFICKVISRNFRQLTVTPGDLEINLDQVSSEFVPIIGDWLEVEAKVEVDENVTDLFGKIIQIDAIRPIRPHILHGSIGTWCEKTKIGSINAKAFFNSGALIAGYIPIVGDKIITEIIESDQGQYSYRSLKIIPQLQQVANEMAINNSFTSFEENVEGITISDNIFINANSLNEQHSFLLQITNNLLKNLILLNVTLPSNNFQCKIMKPSSLTNILLKVNETIDFDCLCVTKSIGITRELILFSFQDFKIGRWITINLKCNFNDDNLDNFQSSNVLSKTYFKHDKNKLIRGQNITPLPRFTYNRLPEYPVPEKLLSVFHKCGKIEDKNNLIVELCTTRPSLKLSLTFNIYEDRFHALLHLMEIDEIISLQSYSQDEAHLIKNGEFLMLEIENLSERRPSLISGDKIIVKNLQDLEADEYEGIIHKIGAKHIYVKFSSTFHDNYKDEQVAVMVIASRTKFRRMHQAVGLAIRNLGKLFLFPSKLIIKKHQTHFTCDDNLDVEKLNNLHNSIENEAKSIETINGTQEILTIKTENYSTDNRTIFVQNLQPVFKLEWYNKYLNFYQKEAIKNILIGEARPLPYIIFGPPGTGKTITLVEVVLQLTRFIPHSRLLIATPSNSAADLIATRLINVGILKPGDLIRLVAHHIVAEDAIPVHLIPYSAVADISRFATGGIQSSNVSNSRLTIGCNSSVIGRHKITIGTCSALGSLFQMGFSKGHFTHIIIDEAGQLLEPEIMIPLSFLDISSGQIILAGDPLQLGPVVQSKAASSCGIEETYMDRMMNRFPFVRDVQAFPTTGGFDPRLITQLLFNYRSLPLILNLFNKLFYEDQLIATISASNSCEADLVNKIKEILPCKYANFPPSVVFHGILGENYQTKDSPSWFNPDEASQVFFYINELYRLGLKQSDIGIISPYIKQIKQIRSLLIEAEFQVPKIGTVEEFQGQEFNVIILSTVRSTYNLVKQDLKFKLGFLSNPRRVNVAISRAKALMIIIGNPHLLGKDVLWRSIINYCIQNNSYCGCDFKDSA